MGGKLLGVVTGRDIDMLEDTKVCVYDILINLFETFLYFFEHDFHQLFDTILVQFYFFRPHLCRRK